jgi:hypothetical protein
MGGSKIKVELWPSSNGWWTVELKVGESRSCGSSGTIADVVGWIVSQLVKRMMEW